MPINCGAVRPADRSSRTPASPADLLSFSPEVMDERVMQKNGRILAAQHAGQHDLTPGRGPRIGPPDHQGDALPHVIDGNSELIRPVTIAVSRQKVAALFGWHMDQSAKQGVIEDLSDRGEPHASPAPGPGLQASSSTSAVIEFAADVLPRALTRIDVSRGAQRLERLVVHEWRVALAEDRLEPRIRLETEPGEIVQKRSLVLGAASDAIMIFDAEQDATAKRTSNTQT